MACPGRRGRDCIRAMLGCAGLVHLSTKLGQLAVHQRPQLDHLALGRRASFPLRPELRAILVGQGLRPSELGSEHAHQLAQRRGFPGRLSDRLYGCLYGWLNARLYGRTNGRGRLLALRKLDQGSPVVPALVTPMQASRPLPGRLGRDAQPLAGLLVGQPFPCDAPALRPSMLSGLSDRTYGPLYAPVRVADWQPGAGQGKDTRSTAGGDGGGSRPASSVFSSSPLFGPGRRPGVDAVGRPSSRRHLAAAARSGGQGRRRLAPGPEPRGPARTRRLAGSTGSMARTHPLPAASTAAPPLRGDEAELSTGGSRACTRRIQGF